MTELEQQLHALRPVRPSPRLAERVSAAVTAPMVIRRRWVAWVWPSLAAAAALVAMLWRSAMSPAEFQAVGRAEFVYGTQTGEVYLAADNTWRRDVRRWVVEQQWWERPTDRAWIEVSVPREEIISMPVNMY